MWSPYVLNLFTRKQYVMLYLTYFTDQFKEIMYLTYLQENFKPVAHRSASVEVFDEEDVQVVHPLPSYWGCQGT